MNIEKRSDGRVRFTDTSGISYAMWTLFLARMSNLGYEWPDAENSIKEYFDRGIFLNLDQSTEVLKVLGELHDTRLYSEEQVARDNNLAKAYFGTTDRLDLAGYLLTDGTLLRLSYTGYMRDRDHREVAYPLDIDTSSDMSAGLTRFLNYGNIRLMGDGFELTGSPLPRQRVWLSKFVMRHPDLYVDISNHTGQVVKQLSFECARSWQVLAEIDAYFDSLKVG